MPHLRFPMIHAQMTPRSPITHLPIKNTQESAVKHFPMMQAKTEEAVTSEMPIKDSEVAHQYKYSFEKSLGLLGTHQSIYVLSVNVLYL